MGNGDKKGLVFLFCDDIQIKITFLRLLFDLLDKYTLKRTFLEDTELGKHFRKFPGFVTAYNHPIAYLATSKRLGSFHRIMQIQKLLDLLQHDEAGVAV